MFIRVENNIGEPVIWINISQIAKIEESRYGNGEVAGYSITCIDNKEYYSPDVEKIKEILEGNGRR